MDERDPDLLQAAREMLKCTGSHQNWQGETERCIKLLEAAVAACGAEEPWPFAVYSQGSDHLMGEFKTAREAIQFGNTEVGVKWYLVDRETCNHWEAWHRESGWVISDERAKHIIANCDGEAEPETPLREKTLLDYITDECGGWYDGKFSMGLKLSLDRDWMLCPVDSNCGRDMVDVWAKTVQMINLHLETGIRPALTDEVRSAAVRAAIENCRVLYHG